MQIYEKVRWLSQTKWKEISNFFSKNKSEQIRKLKKQLLEAWYTFWENLLKLNELEEFEELYTKEISKKENSRVSSLISLYKGEISKEILYFFYIRNNEDLLVGWVIWVLRDGVFILAFKATKDNNHFPLKMRTGVWNLLDYQFFNFWINEISSEYLSMWRDKNWYWFLGSKVSLWLLKLSRSMLPYSFKENREIDIDNKLIKDESLIFTNLWANNQFKKAMLFILRWTSDEEIKSKYNSLLSSEDIQTEIIYI